MTNKISIWLGLMILALIVADWFYLDWQMSLYLGRKLLDMIEYIAFWR